MKTTPAALPLFILAGMAALTLVRFHGRGHYRRSIAPLTSGSFLASKWLIDDDTQHSGAFERALEEGSRTTGTLKNWREQGYGFIQQDNGGPDVFVTLGTLRLALSRRLDCGSASEWFKTSAASAIALAPTTSGSPDMRAEQQRWYGSSIWKARRRARRTAKLGAGAIMLE